jgi:hypothetical protein
MDNNDIKSTGMFGERLSMAHDIYIYYSFIVDIKRHWTFVEIKLSM